MKSGRHKAKPQGGFPHYPMLDFIAILVLLLAMIIPVFLHAQKRSQQNNCLSRLLEVRVALKQYEQDYGELPLGDSQANAELETRLKPYFPKVDLCYCPSAWDKANKGRYIFRESPKGKKTIVEAEDVLAYCTQHLDHDGKNAEWNSGTYLIVRNDTSASRIPAEKVKRRNFQSDKWTELDAETNPADGNTILCFPQETCPPRFK